MKPDPLAKWNELGPINIIDIMKNSTEANPITLDENLVFGKA